MAAGQHFVQQAETRLAWFTHDMIPLAFAKGYVLLIDQQNVFHQVFYVKLRWFRNNHLLKQTEFKIRNEFDLQILNTGLMAEFTFLQQLPPNI